MNSRKLLSLILLAFLSIGTFAQGTLCSSATPFCTAVGTPFSYQNVTDGNTGYCASCPAAGCLFSTPRPSWFYIKSAAAGVMTFSLTQSTIAPGGTPNIDVDFIAYGPYNTAGFATACASGLTGACSADHACTGNIEDCSYSIAATETMTLVATAPGQYFLIMITNYAGTAGFITFTQTGGPSSDCSITCPNVISGDGFELLSGGTVPSNISCGTSPFVISASDNSTFGSPIVPGVMFNFTTNNNTSNQIDMYNSSTGYVGTLAPLTTATNYDYQVYFLNPTYTYTFNLCENNTLEPNMGYSISDLASGNTISFGTWVDDGNCQSIVVPPGAITGVATFTASCGSCITSIPSGVGVFYPSTAGVGTHTITYTFAPGGNCAPYVFSKVITIDPPVITALSSNTTICEGASTTLTVNGQYSQTFTNNTSYSIPDNNTAGISSPITVSGLAGNVGLSLSSVNINIPHTYDSDLEIFLVCPNGSTIALSKGNGGSGDNYSNTTFSTTAATAIFNGTAPFTGIYTPEDPLSLLSGCTTNGIWKLFVTDNSTGDVGTITGWSITFTDKKTYNWTPNIALSTTTGTNVVASPTTTTIYTVTASDAPGCSTTRTITVNVNPKPTLTITPTTTLACSGNTVSLTGSGASTYTWTGGITNGSAFTPSATTSYTLNATSAAGCTNTAVRSVSVNATPSVGVASVSSATICSGNSSLITPSGASTYTLLNTGTSGTSFNVSPTTTTTYSIIGISGAGCPTSNTITTTINVNTTPTVGITSVSSPTLCSGNTSVITPSGASTYTLINTGATGTSFNVSPTGTTTYSIVGSSSSSCPSTNTFTTLITVNTTPTVAISTVSNPSICAGNSSLITPSGASTYTLLNNGATGTSFNVSPTSTTTYSIVGISGSACASTNTITSTITVNSIPTSTASSTGSITCVTTTVSLNSTLAGMNYTWTAPAGSSISGSSNLQNAIGQGQGTYTLNISSSAGCTYSTTVTALQNTVAPTSVNAGANQVLICGVPTVTLNGSASPVSAIANWLGGVASPTNFTTTTGSANTYTLQAINPASGCFITSTVQVTSSIGAPTATINAVTNSITCTNSVVSIGITPTSTGPFTYLWPSTGISGATNNATATATLSGVYTVTLTNSPGNNCSIQLSVTVPINTTAVTASITPAATITCNTPSLTLNASPSGSYSYTWTGSSPIVTGANTQNPAINNGGTYSVSITNTVNGCVGNANISVASNTTIPVVNIAVPSVTTTCGNPTVTIVASATPSTGVTYSWTAPSTGSLGSYTTSNPVASGSGIFTVVVTNTASGCSSSTTQNTVQVTPDLAIPTATLSTTSLSITCFNPTVTVNVSTTSSPVSYSWSPSAGIVAGTATTANPVFNAAGNYSVVITNTASGCASSSASNVVNVSLNNTIPSISLSSAINNGTITCTNTLVTVSPTITPSSNLTYTWSPSIGIATPINQANATFTAAGIYTLAITNTVTGCVTTLTNTANSFTVITNNTTPSFTLGTASSVTTTCSSPNATLSASSNADPNTIYTWTAPSSSTLTGSVVVVSNPGTYSVVITNTVNGCSTSATSPATVDVVADAGIPTVTLSSSSLSITCSNPAPSVTVTTTASPVTYSWTPTAGILAGTQTSATPVFTAAGTYSAVVTNTISGCASGISGNIVNVTLDNLPPVITLPSATNSGSITCINLSVSITPTITPSSSNLTYTWSPGVGISTSVNQANATFTATGVYTLAVTNTLTGCVSTSTSSANSFTVNGSNAAPTASINVTSANSSIGCGASNSTVSISSTNSTGTNPFTVSWLPGNSSAPTLNITSPGTYSLIITDNVNGCADTTAYTVSGSTNTPQGVDAGTSANIACGDATVTLNGISTTTNVSYSWAGPSATSLTGANTTNPVASEVGDYTLTVTDNATGCQSTAVVNVTQAIATASITANPTTGISPLDVAFTGNGAGNPNFSWDFGNGSTSSSQNPNNTFLTGTYNVTLTTTSGSCTATATIQIVVEDGFTLEIPNVFTPNNDASNDIFTIKSTGVKEISLQIFNRWGQKLYEFAGAKAAWDGSTPSGTQVPEGTYFYFVKATGFDGTEVEKNGTVNLFR